MKNAMVIAAALLLLSACGPRYIEPGPSSQAAILEHNNFIMNDGIRLPLRQWGPKLFPRFVVLALHGFNDYSNAFEKPAAYWAKFGVTTYAYDQRGFGGAPFAGHWHGAPSLTADFIRIAHIIRLKHPDVPLFLLGESMGGAVIIAASAQHSLPSHDGIILIAPAIWGRAAMPAWQEGALWILTRFAPGLRVSGGGFGRKPSDNLSMLRQLSTDKKIIKRTRIDAVNGLVDLMDMALSGAKKLKGPALILYGKQEDIIPGKARLLLKMRLLNRSSNIFIKEYESGYHMLLRDLNAEVVWNDIFDWMKNPLHSPSTDMPAKDLNHSK